MRDVPMDLFVSRQWDRFVNYHRRWGRDADTLNGSRNRQGFYMGGRRGHTMHFWELTSAQSCYGPLFVPCAAPADADVEESRECFGVDLLVVPNPEVYILYADLLSNVDQMMHEFTVNDPPDPEWTSYFFYYLDRLCAQLNIVAGEQNCYRTMGRFFCSGLFSASLASSNRA